MEEAGVIRLEGIAKRFGRTEALRGINLEVPTGEFFGLLGPNGAGKSTLIHIMTGFLSPDSGSIYEDGRPVQVDSCAWKTRIGFVPQHLALYERLTAEENLKVFGSLGGLSGRVIRERGAHLLEAVELHERAREPVSNFSGGMKRRLNLIIPLLHEPHCLFCDEPTVGVDPQSRHAIFEFLERLNREGTTVIYTTHYMEEVQRLCSRIAIIDTGGIVAEGTLNQLMEMLPYEEELVISGEAPDEPLERVLKEFGPAEARGEGARVLKINGNFRLSELFAVVEREGMDYRHFRIKEPTLEALFLHLTGHRLRD